MDYLQKARTQANTHKRMNTRTHPHIHNVYVYLEEESNIKDVLFKSTTSVVNINFINDKC